MRLVPISGGIFDGGLLSDIPRLTFEALGGRTAVVELLLATGAELNAEDDSKVRSTPLRTQATPLSCSS